MSAVVTLARRRGAPPPELVTVVVKTLSSGTWGDRRVAALALGALGAKGDVAALVRAAGDSSGFVREAVATALGDVGGGVGVEQALDRLAKDDVAQVREAAEKARAKTKK
jgi:HEAT repeat protein